MIITISGTAGSGKSTIAKAVATEFNAQRIYVGGIRRKIAEEKGMTIQELNQYAKDHPETDVDVDKRAAKEARSLEKEGKLVVVEGRTQFHFLPESLKIFVKVSSKEAAKRIWYDIQNKEKSSRSNEKIADSLEEVEQDVIERDNEDAARYMKYYKIDHRNEAQYDYVLDTSKISATQATTKVLEFIKEKLIK